MSILDVWTDSLTWSGLVDKVEHRLRVRYTRQALHKHVRIADAFASRKKALRVTNPVAKTGSPNLLVALERIARLEAENRRLESENNRLLEQYARWIYNANSKGVSISTMSRPLPTIDRGRTSEFPKGRGSGRTK